MSAWLVILAAGVGSYILRLSLVALFGGVAPPRRLEQLARYVAPAAFAALAAVSLAPVVGHGSAESVPPMAAVAVTVVVARRISPRVALAAGLPALWITGALVHAV